MVTMGSVRAVVKKAILIFCIFAILFTFFYHNDAFYKKLQNSGVSRFVVDIFNEFNFIRLIGQKELPSSDYVDLVLSGDDLKHISTSMRLFVDEGYIRDQINPWRKAKAIVKGKEEEIKFKFHGTDPGSMLARRPFLDKIKKKLGFVDVSSVSPVNSGTFSLKIKHKKKGNYYNLMRRYKLINPYDNHEIFTIILNKMASEIGLIAPFGRTVIFRVNGSEIGPYKLVEAHNKEWFEREHQITNYTIFKSNDDWDRKEANGPSHISDTDLYIENKKVNTISQHSPIAVGALELLLKSIKSNNIRQIKRMIDMDYMAKYMALLAITNSVNHTIGDNLRYVYNHATGRFKLLFRAENGVVSNNQTIAKFNRSFFIHGGDDTVTLKLFKLLLTDSNFLAKRDVELNNIVKNSPYWKSLANKIVVENMRVFLASGVSVRSVEYKAKQSKENFYNNIKKAKQYLDYNKVFVTKYVDTTGKQGLHIVNDFVHPIALKEIHRVGSSGELRTEKTNILINPSKLDIDQSIIYKEQEVDIETTGITKLLFKNLTTNQVILQRHIYINSAVELQTFSQSESLQTLRNNRINYKVDYSNKTITIQSGQYQIDSNVITPYGFNMIIQAGTELLFNEDVSFVVRGGLDVRGTKFNPVVIDKKQKVFAFGVFAVMGEKIEATKVSINHLKFSGGSEAIVNGVLFTGQMSIINSDVVIKNSIFQNSISDDGINIKYSKVDIRDSKFFNNFGDQIDLDYCRATVVNNIFFYEKTGKSNEIPSTDGLDISGSTVYAENNTFSSLSDKGISVGEKSNILISNNTFNNNNWAIAVKDGSKAFIAENEFKKNKVDVLMYIKKKIYNNPSLYTLNSNKVLNLKVYDGTVFYLDNVSEEFEGIQ